MQSEKYHLQDRDSSNAERKISSPRSGQLPEGDETQEDNDTSVQSQLIAMRAAL